MYIIYLRLNEINNKPYIGRTRLTLEKRAGPNGRKYLKKNDHGEYIHPKLANAILKYGWDNFSSHILKEVKTYKESILLEHEYIKIYNSVEDGYNCNYGESERKEEYFSKETLSKMSNAKKKKPIDNSIYLKIYKENMIKHPDKYPNPMSNEITRKKISDSKIGSKNPMYGKEPPNKGKKVSPETLRKIRNNAKYGADNILSKAVVAIDKDTNEIVYEFGGVCEAARYFKQANETAIIACLKGRSKSSAGYYWKYKKDITAYND